MNPYSPALQRIPPARRWWKTTPAALGILALVAIISAFSFPLGFLVLITAVVLLWVLPPWPWFAKLGASVGALFLLTIGAGLGGQLEDTDKDAKPVVAESRTPSAKASQSRAAEQKAPDYSGEHLDEAEDKARAAGYTTGHHDASVEDRAIVLRSGWLVCFQKPSHDDGRKLIDFAAVKDGEPCPEKDGGEIPWPTMPDLTGKTWQAAVTVLTDLEVDKNAIRAESHYLNDDLPDDGYDSWRVCEQTPAKGEDVTVDVTLELAHPKAGCSTDGAYLGDKDHDGRPNYRDQTDDRETDTTGGSGNGSSAGSSTSGGGSSSTGGSGQVVHPGSFCSPAGATGVTSAGTLMVCGPGSDGRNRWRSA